MDETTMDIVGNAEAIAASTAGILSRDRIIARPGFNRWLVPPAALAIHLCIGMAYGFSVFWLPLSQAVAIAAGAKVPACAAGATNFWEKAQGTLIALTAKNCEWTQFDLGWMYTLFFVVLGCSAAILGAWLERAGPRKAGVIAAFCWCGGLMVSAVGVRTNLPLMAHPSRPRHEFDGKPIDTQPAFFRQSGKGFEINLTRIAHFFVADRGTAHCAVEQSPNFLAAKPFGAQ
jgi:hypothetical protein